MAAPKAPSTFNTTPDDAVQRDTDDLPEFDSTNTAPHRSGVDRATLNFDAKKYNEEQKQMTNPTGDWLRDERWDFDPDRHIVTRQDDTAPGDLLPTGRITFLFGGKPQERIINGVSYQPHLFCRLSPDTRYKIEEPDKFDLPHRLFLMAREVYLTIHGEELINGSQLIYLMTEDTIILNTMNGDDGPVVLRIKAPQQRRRTSRR